MKIVSFWSYTTWQFLLDLSLPAKSTIPILNFDVLILNIAWDLELSELCVLDEHERLCKYELKSYYMLSSFIFYP